MKTYNCKNCKEEWTFFPEDYGYRKKLYPDNCPLCNMPVLQMIKDTYQEGGIREVIYWLKRRYLTLT